MEVDTVFSIANPFAFYYINKDFISDDKIFTGIEKQILEKAKEKAEEPKSTARYNKFLFYEQEIFNSDLHQLKGKYIIPMTAISIIDPTTGQKEIICPFSNQNIVTSKMLELLEGSIPLEFLQRFVFWPISPIDFMFCFGSKDGKKGIIHPLENIVNAVNNRINGIGFGNLFKNDYGVKQGNFNVYAGVLESRYAVNRFGRHPQSFDEKMRELGCATEQDYLDYCNASASFCRKILAQKYVHIFNKLDLVSTLYAFKVPEIIYFGEKTSYGAKVLELVRKYSKEKFPFGFIGDGPLSNIDEITSLGIAHDTAMHKLFGFITKLYEAEKKVSLKRPLKREIPAWEKRGGSSSGNIEYRQCPHYNFFLCEISDCRSPCAKDIIDTELSEKDLQYIVKFADYKRVGFSRIEPRLVQLANQDFRVFVGDRKTSKLNSSWQHTELAGKKIKFIDLEEFVSKETDVGDLRGSEFTMPCDIMRIFSKLNQDIRYKIIAEELERHPELKKDFFRTNDPDTFEGIAAIRGTAIHKVTAFPVKSLAHYETLARGGLDVLPSSKYTELSFVYRHIVRKTGEEIKITFHPDCQFALQGREGLDLVIIDNKTNRKLPYPYVKYKNQGKVYAYCLKRITRINFRNTYLIFNHMAFDNMFGMTFSVPEGYPGSEGLYRAQSFIPPTVYYPEHNFDRMITREIDRTYLAQKNIKEDPKRFLKEKAKKAKQKENGCAKCFLDQIILCNYFTNAAERNISLKNAVERLKE
ncbi:MAG: hypothetical protein QXD13_02390 [Candidatus Pacearchaeota archaeon]